MATPTQRDSALAAPLALPPQHDSRMDAATAYVPVEAPVWRGNVSVPPLGMMLAISSTTVAAMLFMTILALAVVCRCDRRPRGARLIAVAVPVIEVTGRVPGTLLESVHDAMQAELDERAPILVLSNSHATESASGRLRGGSGGGTAGAHGGSCVASMAAVVIGTRA